MSRGGDPQDAYDGYDEPDGYNDAYENERERSGSLFPYSVPWGGWSSFFGRSGGASEEYEDRTAGTPGSGTPAGEYEGTYDEEAYDAASEDDDGSWWEEGLAGTLILAGVVLFFFPEPATSMLGIVLISAGVLAWVVDALA